MRKLKGSHTGYFVGSHKWSGTGTLTSKISVIVRPEDVPTDGILYGVLRTSNGNFVILDGVQVYLVDGHHGHAAIRQIRNQEGPEHY